MDKSEKYMLMCKKAEEIQEFWVPLNGDYFINGQGVGVVIYLDGVEQSIDVWLPRMDQLCDILNYKDWSLLLIDLELFGLTFWTTNNELHHEKNKYSKFCNSMEQLLLAFLMKKKYNKIWKKDKWINE